MQPGGSMKEWNHDDCEDQLDRLYEDLYKNFPLLLKGLFFSLNDQVKTLTIEKNGLERSVKLLDKQIDNLINS